MRLAVAALALSLVACSTVRVAPSGRISPAAAERLQAAGVAHSWAGPCRWGTLGMALGTVGYVAAGDVDGAVLLGGIAVTSLNLACALILDGVAERHIRAASGIDEADHGRRKIPSPGQSRVLSDRELEELRPPGYVSPNEEAPEGEE